MSSESWDDSLASASHEWDVRLEAGFANCKRPTELSEVPRRRCRSATSVRPQSATTGGTVWRKSASTLTVGGRDGPKKMFEKPVGGVMFPSRRVLRSGAIAPEKPEVLWAGRAEGPEPDGKLDLDAILRPAMKRCQEDRVMRQRYRTAALVKEDSSLAWTRMARFNAKGLACGFEDEAGIQVSPDLTTDSEFAAAALQAHNEMRAMHGVPPLRWSEILAGRARMYADDVCRGEVPPEDVSLSRCRGDSASDSAFNAVAGWYAGGSAFDIGATHLTAEAFAYVLILWRSTTHVGMNLDESGRVIAAVYYPPANMEGPFAANVLPPLGHPVRPSAPLDISSLSLSSSLAVSSSVTVAPQAQAEKAGDKEAASLKEGRGRPPPFTKSERRVCHNGCALQYPLPKELPRYPRISLEELWALKGM